jgi:two-component system sensor histidine kinase GlrK
MRVSIFWRVILAQSALMALVLAVSLYAYSELNWLTRLQSDILAVDSRCIREEKQMLRDFLLEMRNAEKYFALKETSFFDGYIQGSTDFKKELIKVGALADTEREKELLDEINTLHTRYESALMTAVVGFGSWDEAKTTISNEIIDKGNELIRLREQALADKSALAKSRSSAAAGNLGWLTGAGMLAGLLLAYAHARGVVRPLKKLSREMERLGRGKFGRSIEIRAPREVHQLTETFNRMASELGRLDRLKSDFTAHVSHELRTPLTAIQEGTALLLEEVQGPLSQGQREILGIVHHHSDRLSRTISSILDLSKMEAEMMEYEFTPCDLAGLIRTSVDAVDVIAQKKEIDLRAVIDEPLPLLSMDERRIRQVLDNLLGNALKFTPEGGRVLVSASVANNGEAEADCVEVRVSDTGEGISEGDTEKVFERFYQSSNGQARNQHGTGLGLAIARHIVEAHKGRIWLQSTKGEGCVFIFSLPIHAGTGDIAGASCGSLLAEDV